MLKSVKLTHGEAMTQYKKMNAILTEVMTAHCCTDENIEIYRLLHRLILSSAQAVQLAIDINQMINHHEDYIKSQTIRLVENK